MIKHQRQTPATQIILCNRLPSLDSDHIRYNWEFVSPPGVSSRQPLRFHIIAVGNENVGNLVCDSLNALRKGSTSIQPFRALCAPLLAYDDVELRLISSDSEIDPNQFEFQLKENLRKGPYGKVWLKQDKRLLHEVSRRTSYEARNPSTSNVLQERVAKTYDLGPWRALRFMGEQFAY